MRKIEVVLQQPPPPEVPLVLHPPQVSVMQQAAPPNLGPRTKQALEQVEPLGHHGLMPDGSLILILNGQLADIPNSFNVEEVAAEVQQGKPIVLYGIGCGQLLTKVRTLSEESRAGSARPILVYEPDARILKSFLRLNLPMQGVTICSDLADFRQMFPVLLQGEGSCSIFHNAYAVNADPMAFDVFLDSLRRIVDAEQVTMNTITIRMPEWVRHVSSNVEMIPGTKPLMSLVGEFPGVPAFIVGAGPSLDKNGHLLNECRRRGLVFTVDVTARSFSKFGSEPHIFVAVEGQDLSEHLQGVGWVDHVLRAFSLEASPAVLRCGNGPLLPWVDSNHAFKDLSDWVLNTEGLPIGGSATTAAFLMAEAFGCNPIIMVGQDLANTGGKRAAGSVLSDKLAVLSDHGTVSRWGDDDGHWYNPRSQCHYWAAVTDTPQWLHARVWFEQRAQDLNIRKPETVLVNATEGGSHVRGFKDVRLSDILAELPDNDFATQHLLTQLEGVPPISGETVDWWRRRQIETLAPLISSAEAVAAAIREASLLMTSGAPESEIQEVVAKAQGHEATFRRLAVSQAMFTGSVQPELRALNKIREEAVQKSVEGVLATEFFIKQAELFEKLSTVAATLWDAVSNP